VTDNLRLNQQNTFILFLVLVVFGIAVQAGWLRWIKRTVIHR
jgi:hypothetical protein